jgi:NADH-quinone oxidoreductase subunit N
MLYAATGSFSLDGYSQYINNDIGAISPIFYLGVTLLIIGLLFKVSVAPFHFWAPDVYDGAPIPFTAFMSTVVKMAGFAAIFKVLSVSMIGLFDFWWTTLAVCAFASLLVGNLVAASQTSFKRLLAYSGISHAGYLLVSVASGQQGSAYDLLFYAFSYSLASVLAFYVLDAVAKETGSEDLDALKGFAKNNRFLGFVLTIAMLSLAGLPLTGGFIGKFLIFSRAIEVQRMAWLVFAGIIISVVGAYYYIKPVAAAYFKDGYTGGEVEINTGKRIAITLAVVGTIILGILPVVFNLFWDAL